MFSYISMGSHPAASLTDIERMRVCSSGRRLVVMELQ
jgi:hypothetical protein